MRYGHFDDANCEYVVEKPNTPLPWINYLGTQKYCALISNTAGGYSFYQDPTLFSFVEFCLWDAVGDSTNFQRTWSIGKAYCDGFTIIHDTLHKSWVDILAFFVES